MSMRSSRGYRIGLGVLTVACLGGAGYLAYRTFFASGDPAKELQKAEQAYARGVDAYEKQKNWPEAVARFDEAAVQSDKATEALDKQTKAGKIQAEEARRLQGRILWVKARAIRDRAFSRAQVEGKPLPEFNDPQYNEMYRPFAVIPIVEELNEARTALRTATDRLHADPEFGKQVLKASLRTELSPPINWLIAEQFLRWGVESDPKDPRAQFYLARCEFEQPDAQNIPTASDKKNADRVKKAADHLKIAQDNKSPYWRSVGLQADILRWQAANASRKAKADPAATAAAEAALDKLLFDSPGGALATAQRGEKIDTFGTADTAGALEILATAMTRAVAETRKGGSANHVRLACQAGLGLANKLASDPAAKSHFPDVFNGVVQAIAVGLPVLVETDTTGAEAVSAELDALVAKSADTLKARPAITLGLARITEAKAERASRTGDTSRAKGLRDQAIKQAEEALKAAGELQPPPAWAPFLADECHATLAEWKLHRQDRIESIDPHIAHLRKSPFLRWKKKGEYFSAIIAERQGRLAGAIRLLEPLANDRTDYKTSADVAARDEMAFQADIVLSQLYLATGEPEKALDALRKVAPRFDKFNELSPTERVWAEDYLRGADGVYGLQVLAYLNTSLQAINRYTREHPGQQLDNRTREAIRGYEKAVNELLAGRLKNLGPANRQARLAYAAYEARTGRRDEAEARLGGLAQDYKDSLDVLRARTTMLITPRDSTATGIDKNGVSKADLLIKQFLEVYKDNTAAKLYWAEWLVRTDRPTEAINYLGDPKVFPEGGDAVNRIRVTALYQAGRADEARQVLSQLAPDPVVDALLIRAAASREAGDKRVREALGRYENQGFFRVYEGITQLGDKKYPEAIQTFASAIELTQVRPVARAGLQQAMAAYALVDPPKARETALKLAEVMPNEPTIYLGAADAALAMEDIGTPADNWVQKKTMYAAVNKWREVARAELKISDEDANLVKARARLVAGDLAGARTEAMGNRKPDGSFTHFPTLLFLAELALAPPADTATARERYETALRLTPNDPRLPYLDALIKQTDGKWTEAAEVYARLVALAPRNPTPYARLLHAQEKANKPEDALKTARAWYAATPDDARAAVALIRQLALAKALDEAKKTADEFVNRRKEAAEKAAGKGLAPTAKAAVEKTVEEARLSALLATATGFSAGKAYDEAKARANQVLKARPDADRAEVLLGEIAIAEEKWDEALAIYRKMLDRNPRHFIAGNNLAWILAEKKNDAAGALKVVDEIRKASAGGPPVGAERLPAAFLDTIGAVYVKAKRSDRYEAMRRDFEAAVQRYPADPRMLLYLGQAYQFLGEGARAAASFQQAIALANGRSSLTAEENKEVIKAVEKARGPMGKSTN